MVWTVTLCKWFCFLVSGREFFGTLIVKHLLRHCDRVVFPRSGPCLFMSFSTPFSDLASKIHTLFQTCRWSQNATLLVYIKQKLCHHCKKKDFLKSIHHFRICMLQFLSYSFGTKTTNTLIHNRSSLVNHTRFQTKNYGQNLYPFSDQNGTKTLPFGWHIPIHYIHTYMAYIRDSPPHPSLGSQTLLCRHPLNTNTKIIATKRFLKIHLEFA